MQFWKVYGKWLDIRKLLFEVLYLHRDNSSSACWASFTFHYHLIPELIIAPQRPLVTRPTWTTACKRRWTGSGKKEGFCFCFAPVTVTTGINNWCKNYLLEMCSTIYSLTLRKIYLSWSSRYLLTLWELQEATVWWHVIPFTSISSQQLPISFFKR